MNGLGKGCLLLVLLGVAGLVVLSVGSMLLSVFGVGARLVLPSGVLHLVALLFMVLVFFAILRAVTGGSGERSEGHGQRERDMETIQRQNKDLEKMARRIESLETILMDEDGSSSSRKSRGGLG